MVYSELMIRLNIAEAKTHLSRYLARLEAGETILLCRRNEPIAEIRPLAKRAHHAKRPPSLDPGFEIPDSAFFDPLPDELLDAFEGRGEPGE